MGYISTMEYYSDILKKWNNAICSNINGPRDHPTKWNKSDKAKYQMMSTICEVLKKKDTNEFTKQKQSHRLWKQTWLTKGGNPGRG